MSKHMKIFLILLGLLFIVYLGFAKIIDIMDDMYIKDRFGSLNEVKIEEVKTLPLDQLSTKYYLYCDLLRFLKESRGKNDKEVNKKIESVFPKFNKIRNEWFILAHKRIGKVFENRNK